MSYFLIYGAIAAVSLLGVGLLAKQTILGSLTAIVGFVLFGWIGWLVMPVLGWNFPGNWLMLFILGLCTATIGFSGKERIAKILGVLPFILGIFGFLVLPFMTSTKMLNASKYQRILQEPIVSVFSDDVSPVNIKQVRAVDREVAMTVGSKAIESIPGLGSRVDLAPMNLQHLNGCFTAILGSGEQRELCFENDLMWVGPLVHVDIFKWMSNKTTPGYVLVSATNSSRMYFVKGLVQQPEAESVDESGRMGATTSARDKDALLELRYLEQGGYFDDRLERHVRKSGYASKGLADFSFEIDNDGNPYWVITHFEKRVGFGGNDTVGVVLVHVETGEIQYYDMDEAPAWVDRIVPEKFVDNQLRWWGSLQDGWINSVFAKNDVTVPTAGTSIVYGSNGESYWYTGMQSAGSDSGTNSFVLVNTRSGVARQYLISGANEQAARGSAENAPGVREAGFVGSNPILYNISGKPTYFVPLKGADGLVKMYAFVSVENYEVVGVGRSAQEALRDYQNAFIRSGNALDIQDLTRREQITSVIIDVVQIGDTFYLLLEGSDSVEYYGTADVDPEIKWARPGQTVTIITDENELSSVQVLSVDIEGIDL